MTFLEANLTLLIWNCLKTETKLTG